MGKSALWPLFLKKSLLDQDPFCGTTDCPYFGLHVTLPICSKPGWFSRLHTYLLACGEPKGHVWCYTCLFHQKGCILYKHVYSRPAFQTSLMQAAEGRQWWMLTFGSSEIQSCAARSTSELLAVVRFNLVLPDQQANVLSTRPCRLALWPLFYLFS